MARYKLGPLLAGVKYDAKLVNQGAGLYVSNCVFCHGVPGVDKGGNIPNLGYADPQAIEHLEKTLFTKRLEAKGMPNFAGKLTDADVDKLKAFIQGVADSVRGK